MSVKTTSFHVKSYTGNSKKKKKNKKACLMNHDAQQRKDEFRVHYKGQHKVFP